MTKERLEEIRKASDGAYKCAEEILEGEADNYDGADGAREVQDLCCFINELLQAIEEGGK